LDLAITAVLLYLLFKTLAGNTIGMASWIPLANLLPKAEAFTPEAIQSQVTLILALFAILDLFVIILCFVGIYFCIIKRKLQKWRIRYKARQPADFRRFQYTRDDMDLEMAHGETRKINLDENPCVNITVRDHPSGGPTTL